MTVTVRILPDLGLVLARYAGMATEEATLAAWSAATADPAFGRCTRHLVDLRAVVGYARHYDRFLAMQAQIADHVGSLPPGLLLVFLAPTRTGQEMAQMARKSWEGVGDVRFVVVTDNAGACQVLGLPEHRAAMLLPVGDAG